MTNTELKDLIRKAYKAGRKNALKQDEANVNDFLNKHESKLKCDHSSDKSYKSIDEAKKLKNDQLVLTRCSEWCDEGYSVARWHSADNEFFNSDAPNDMFHEYVTGFIELNDDGLTSV